MIKKLSLWAFLLIWITSGFSQGTTGNQSVGNKPQGRIVWTTNPFDYKEFIENKGQFDNAVRNSSSDWEKSGEDTKILFAARSGSAFVYFTTNGIIYRYIEYKNNEDPASHDPDAKGPPTVIPHYLYANWTGSNPGVTITTDEQLSYPFKYPKGNSGTYTSKCFRKLTYHNLYPGIDAIFTFLSGKENGIEYTLIVNPGADLSAVNLTYSGDENIQKLHDGSIKVICNWGGVIDKAPHSHYTDSKKTISSEYIINDNRESFHVSNLDHTKTLIIDPASIVWTTNKPINASPNDGAYDCDYDYAGNVYVYGGEYPFQIVKLNSSGVIQWTYATSNFTYQYYGDFCVDKHSQSVYACEAFQPSGPHDDKIGPGGNLISVYTGTSSEDEQWRMTYDLCNHEIIIAGGGTEDSSQAAVLDTNMVHFSWVDVLNFPNKTQPYCLHDMVGVAEDPLGKEAYMATAKSVINPTIDSNHIVQMALPPLIPTNYNVSDKFDFTEVGSITYVGTGVGIANGMNCMASSPDWLYMYDGKTLRQYAVANGKIHNTATVGTSSFGWGGIDVDLCDNIYMGNQTNIDVYNVSLAATGTIGPFPDKIYDVVLGNGVLGYGDTTLYTCGDGFVSKVFLTPPVPPKIEKTLHKVCSCNCSAKATLMLCGNPDTTNVSYQWSNNQTTQTATALCPGNTYTITITVGCGTQFTDTVNISQSGLLNVTKTQTPPTCATPGNASVTVSGGIPPYNYLWSNNATSSSIPVASAGTYCVSITDSKGCNDTVCFIIPGPQLPNIQITPNPDSLCRGNNVTLNASGGVSYVWSNGATESSINVTPLVTTAYSVIGTDVNGCKNSDTSNIVVIALPVLTVSPSDTTICKGQSVTLSATGAATYTWTPATDLSCNSCASPICTPTGNDNYIVTGKDAFGCSTTVAVTVNLELPAAFSLTPAQSICEGGAITLSVSGPGGVYIWMPGNVTGQSITVSPSSTTVYTVTLQGACGNRTDTMTLFVNPLPNVGFSSNLPGGCAPLCINFRDLTSGSISYWSWQFGNGDSSDKENPLYCFPAPGTYGVTLTATSNAGCSSTLSVPSMITVYSKPASNFTESPQPATIVYPNIQFTDASSDKYGIIYWQWIFGDNGDTVGSILENPSHIYGDTGTYCPTLITTNIYGCSDSITHCLIIAPDYTLYIPNAFTPGQINGLNNFFTAKGSYISNFEMYIYDRWGMQLYHTTDINKGWNGAINNTGNVCQEDTYVYVIKVKDVSGNVHNYLGKLSLLK